jgi:hypothetical protein
VALPVRSERSGYGLERSGDGGATVEAARWRERRRDPRLHGGEGRDKETAAAATGGAGRAGEVWRQEELWCEREGVSGSHRLGDRGEIPSIEGVRGGF